MHISISSPNTEFNYPLSKILDDSLSDGLITTLKIGGYLIIFSIISTLLIKIPFIPLIIKTFLISTTEITSGTYYINKLPLKTIYKLFLCSLVCISGGLSTYFQINSVIKKVPLHMKDYLFSKCISIGFCILIFLSYISLYYI